jgi:hypothetical protein
MNWSHEICRLEISQLSPDRHIRLATHGRSIQMCHNGHWRNASSRPQSRLTAALLLAGYSHSGRPAVRSPSSNLATCSGRVAQRSKCEVEMELQSPRIVVICRLYPGSRCLNSCPMPLWRKRGSISATSITRSVGSVLLPPVAAPDAYRSRSAPAHSTERIRGTLLPSRTPQHAAAVRRGLAR